MSKRAVAAVVLAGAMAGSAFAAPAVPAPSARPVAQSLAVERAGTVRVALPAALYPTDVGFQVVGPDGARVPWHLVVLDTGGATRARVLAVTAVSDGWQVVIDAGPAPPVHQGLRLALAVEGLVRVDLEASRDRKTWAPLAQASLFRLGPSAELQGSVLEYPPTAARYLRLHWPAAADFGDGNGAPRSDRFPRLAEVQLDRVAPAVEEVDLPATACAAEGGKLVVCKLDALGDRTVDGLAVSLPAGRAVGWRLRVASSGRWQLLGDGTWAALSTEAPRRIPACWCRGPLRLELWGESEPPVPLRLTARLPALAIEIAAPGPGTYELRSARGLPRPATAAATADRRSEWVTPGPARELAPPRPLPVAGGGPLPKVSFTQHWPVQVEASTGEAVRLPLPGAVESAARPDLGDLRLARQGRQVPYLVDDLMVPERAAAWERVAPQPQGEGVSRVELPLPATLGRLPGELLLRVPARPLRRDVRLLRPGATAGAGEPPPITTPWTEWHCEPSPPLPCELALSLPAAGGGPLQIEIRDADNAPLAELSAELWRLRRSLLLPWPGGTVALLAGAPRLPSPAYDLAAVESELRARPARTARLGPAAEGWEGAPARWPRWAVLSSLALAATVLLLLLARALPRMPTPAGRARYHPPPDPLP